MAFGQQGKRVLDEGLGLDVRRICHDVYADRRLLREEVNARLTVTVIRNIGRPNVVPIRDQRLRDMPAAAARLPYFRRKLFQLKQLLYRSGGVA